jgi:3',5'-cyclic AMP phosphodiesterase CpdA
VTAAVRSRLLVSLLALGVGVSALRSTPPAVQPTIAAAQQAAAAPEVALPNKADSLKFGVLGDFGTGGKEQYQLAEQMARLHTRFPYELVLTVGDNLYGSQGPNDFRKKFEVPYKPLLDGGVKFYASLGNHDSRGQRFYQLFHMDGRFYYTFSPRSDIRFFALDSTYLSPEQIQWIDKALQSSGSDWKIAFFHHPLYSSGERHGSDQRLRKVLEPIFLQHNISVVFAGHDHFYERVIPQKGIAYFVVGSGGKLRDGNIDAKSGLTARGFDTDLAFLAVEIVGDELYFNALSRQGHVVDSGVIKRRQDTP